jgi:Flp pilus assembly protein TadD
MADTLSDCSQNRNSALRLHACTDVIAGAGYSVDQKALAYRNRGNARSDAGAGGQAVADFSEAIRLQSNEPAGYAGRGRARLIVRDVDGAIADYSEAIRLTPETASLHIGRGHMHTS